VRWGLVVPIKELDRAKTRMLDHTTLQRRDLARAFALDTVDAARAAPSIDVVVVVTADATVASELAPTDVVVAEPEPGGLNAAMTEGARWLHQHRPELGTAALCADLPALRTSELEGALAAAAQHQRAFVPDASGAGTTLLTSLPGSPFEPRFGPGSARHHLESGATAVPAGPTVRRDVDDARDLGEARDLGLGLRTQALATASASDSRRSVQGTVSAFDVRRRHGLLLTDAGAELAFDPAAFDRSGLRLVRPGQRLVATCTADGTVTAVNLLGLSARTQGNGA
jgi:2-phospho-L-lactate/phosphoenolpyruvate guanylyltransferase